MIVLPVPYRIGEAIVPFTPLLLPFYSLFTPFYSPYFYTFKNYA